VPDGDESGIDIPKLTPSGFFIHAAAYFATAFLGLLTHRNLISKILLFIIVHGLFMEGLQYFIPYRSFNPLDIMANLCGIMLAFLIIFPFQLNK
jgi:glycopeptide antibiotics resistance protein